MCNVMVSIFFLCSAFSLCAAEILTEWASLDGKIQTKRFPLEWKGDAATFTIKRGEIGHATRWIAVKPDFAKAMIGEAGYFVLPNGHLGEFTKKNGKRRVNAPAMPFFGMKTPRESFVAIVTGLPYQFSVEARAKEGQYELFPIFDKFLPQADEDIEIQFHRLTGADANYAGMARKYRKYQLDRGIVRPLSERAKDSKELAYAAKYPEIRVRQGWKPVPSPVPEQTIKDEPPMKVAITFDRFMQIVDECKRQGVAGAEFCLVGWNQKGHDGRWPQIFPVEEALGGEEKLRQAIRYAQTNGFQVVAHGNHRDAYMIADSWDAEYIMEKENGILKRGKTSWGGGRMYTICPKRAYERFAVKDTPMIGALGFRGLHYLDVFSCVAAPRCTDPRHPLSERESAHYIGAIMQLGREVFGGCASEGPYDHFAGQLDSVLYVSFDNPLKPTTGLTTRLIPLWQLVYHGIILSTPYTTTVNAAAKDRASQLKLVEFGGRPTFYFYSKFKSDNKSWMGDIDLTCETDEALHNSVSFIKKGADEYAKLASLQYAFMDHHEQIQPHLFRTVFSDGTEILTNYAKEPISVQGHTIAAESYLVLKHK